MLVSKKYQSSAVCWSLHPTSKYHGNEDDFLGKIEAIPIQSYIRTSPNSICCGYDSSMLVLNDDHDIKAKAGSDVLSQEEVMLMCSSMPLRIFPDSLQQQDSLQSRL
jgi:hypothetical protein